MNVTQHLWFEKDMEAAISFYTSLIPGSSVHWISALPAECPSGPAGSVKIASFTLGDQRYMAIEAGPLDGKAKRVAEAMLQMVKFDIDTLEAAARG